MGGKPYPDGVKKVIELLDRVAAAECELPEVLSLIERSKVRAEDLRTERAVAWDEYRKLMRDMDVSSEGNHGFEARAGWFLTEIRRQIRKATLDAALKEDG